MLDVNAAFQSAIGESKLKIAELYDFTLASGEVCRFTSHGQNLIWNAAGDKYTALPIERNAIQNNINLEVDLVDIRLGNISGPLFDLAQKNTLNNIRVTIKRILWDQPYAADMEITYFIGIGDISFDRKELVISCKTILDSLNIKVPRCTYQEPCVYRLYDDSCALVQSDYGYAGVIATGSRLKFNDTVRGTVKKIAFTLGDEDNPIQTGDDLESV